MALVSSGVLRVVPVGAGRMVRMVMPEWWCLLAGVRSRRGMAGGAYDPESLEVEVMLELLSGEGEHRRLVLGLAAGC